MWFVDSQAVKQQNYDGVMKLEASNLISPWFLRLSLFDREPFVFSRYEGPEGSGEWWYSGI